MRDWIANHVRRCSLRYRPPRGGNIRPDLRKERKELAGRYYLHLSGHVAAGAYLADKIKKVPSSGCW